MHLRMFSVQSLALDFMETKGLPNTFQIFFLIFTGLSDTKNYEWQLGGLS